MEFVRVDLGMGCAGLGFDAQQPYEPTEPLMPGLTAFFAGFGMVTVLALTIELAARL